MINMMSIEDKIHYISTVYIYGQHLWRAAGIYILYHMILSLYMVPSAVRAVPPQWESASDVTRIIDSNVTRTGFSHL